MALALTTRIAQEHAAILDSLPTTVVKPEHRREAIVCIAEKGLPTSRDENWKYTNLRPLEKVRFAPAEVGANASDLLPRITSDDLPSAIEGYARYTFVDGVFAPALSAPIGKTGIAVTSLRSDRTETVMGAILQGDARFALLNEAFATDGASIRVAAGIDCPRCIELVFVASVDAQTGSSYPRIQLVVEEGARLDLIERHVSIGSGANFVSPSVRIVVSSRATLNHYRVQESGARAAWFDTLSATVAADGVYKLHDINLGGLSARSTIHVLLSGKRAQTSISMASLGDRQQTQDAFVLVEHTGQDTRSEQIFRGISAGRARVAFNGKVIVRDNGKGTDSQQSLRGLLAGAEAEIDVRPQLEIYNDDVRCAHGATAGKLDDNMMFYLLSRGIDAATAQRLLKWAFLEDVVAGIGIPELRRQIERSLAGQMQETTALRELL